MPSAIIIRELVLILYSIKSTLNFLTQNRRGGCVLVSLLKTVWEVTLNLMMAYESRLQKPYWMKH